jgi:cell volume regulation protein A
MTLIQGDWVTEPFASAVMVGAFGLLLVLAVTFSRTSARLGVPLALGFLLIGVLAGSEGIARIPFEDYRLTFQIGTAALVLILFDGGLNTPSIALRESGGAAAVLATVGVALTALMTAAAARLFGFVWPIALLLGAIVSSTDAAAVFSALSASGLHLKRRVGHLLEVESGLNDPMAVILTTALTANLIRPGSETAWSIGLDVVIEMAIGGATGYAIGRLGQARMARLRLPAPGLYPAYTLGIACLAYGIPTLIHGSGFLSVYVAGATLGQRSLPYATSVRRVHDALGWLSQIVMFLLLGLLVFPSRLLGVAGAGFGIALVLVFVARPLVVALCLAPFRYPSREIFYVGWVGLRGAVPIVLATIPVMSGAPGSRVLFDVVFFIVVVGSLMPGSTVPWITRRLRMESGRASASATVAIDSADTSKRLRSFFMEPELAVIGAPIETLPLPAGAAITMVDRAGTMIAATPATIIEAGDHVYVLYDSDDESEISLLFGRPGE